MSIIDGKMGQSARMYFRQKDHKDAYFESKWHGVMMYSDDNSELHGVYWRKMFEDRYVVYLSQGNQQRGHFTLLYPGTQTVVGEVDFTQDHGAFTQNCNIYTKNYWSDKLRISSLDRRVTKDYEVSLSFRQHGTWYAVKNGILISNQHSAGSSNQDVYYIKVKESEDINNPCYELDSCELIISNQNIGNIATNGHSDLVVYKYNGSDNLNLLNLETGETISNIYTIQQYDYLNFDLGMFYANGRCFLMGRYGWNVSIWKVDEDSITRKNIRNQPDSPSRSRIEYHNGWYYVYAYYNYQGPLVCYRSQDLETWTDVLIPSSITVPGIDNESSYTFNTVEYLYGGSFNFQFFEKSEPINDVDELFFIMSYGFENNDSLIVYIDNPTFQESVNNFAYKTSWIRSHYEPMKMWEHYYSI